MVCACLWTATLTRKTPLDIHVYEYEILVCGGFTFETHLNHIGKGTRPFEGPAAPLSGSNDAASELNFQTAPPTP